MSILFDFYEAPPKEGEEDKLRVYARPVFSQTVSTEELASIVHSRCSLTEGDVLSAITSLSKVITEKLCDGQRVHLDGIGYFSVTLQCYNVQTPEDMRGNNVGVKSVAFRMDKNLKSNLMQARVTRSAAIGHSAQLTNEEVDGKVAEYFKANHVLTRRGLQDLCLLKKGLAQKHLNRMLEEGKIKNIGIRRQPIYVAG